jgi:hypothetical protein
MKKIIFQDLMAIKQSWSSQLWKYFLVSVVFHCLLIYVLVTVPLTTPAAGDFPSITAKSSPGKKSREPLTTKIAGEPTGVKTGNRSNQSRGYPGSYPGISGSRADADKILEAAPRETLYSSNYDTRSSEVGSNKAGIDKDIEPLPETVTVYKYQLSAPDRRLDFNSDRYIRLYEKPFRDVRKAPISGLPVKKRTASYQKVKQFIEGKQLPPEQLVKIEEMINYFYYDYPLPKDEHPFSVTTELAACPWKAGHWLLHIGVQGKIVTGAGGKIDDKEFIIAADVKIQVVFNPDKVRAYRLIGYGHLRPKLRRVKAPDEGKEHGELLMGQSLTTLYEIIPLTPGNIDAHDTRETPAKPQEPKKQEIARVKVTYKAPNGTKTKEVSQKVWEMEEESQDKEPSNNFKFSAAVAEFGMLLLIHRESRVSLTLAALLQLAKDAIGEDRYGYRAEFIKLVEAYQQITEEKGGRQ